MPGAVGVVLAAGTGTRVGADGNKAYLRLGGRSMVSWSLESVAAVPDIARTVLVIRRGERELAERTLQDELPAARVELVEGGDSRHALGVQCTALSGPRHRIGRGRCGADPRRRPTAGRARNDAQRAGAGS